MKYLFKTDKKHLSLTTKQNINTTIELTRNKKSFTHNTIDIKRISL